jgi:tetratricopeptide (TPR) repeat protein
MRRLVFSVLAASLVPFAVAEEELFTGTAPEKVPPDVQRFLTAVKKALENGEPPDVLKLAYNQGMSGAAWVVFRGQLPVYSKEKPLKVKRIELIEGAGDDAVQFKIGPMLYKRALPATHLVSFTIETSTGELARFEVPSAKVADADNNSEYWRLLPAMPQLPANSTLRLEEAKARAEAQPAQAYSWVEVTYLHGVLGHRDEVEKGAAHLAELTKKKPMAYVESQLGWTYLNLGDIAKALEHFKAGYEIATAEGGRYWNAEYAYAAGLFANGQTGDAVKHFDHAAGLGTILTERKSLEEWLKNETARERELVLGLQGAWLRTAVPKQIR